MTATPHPDTVADDEAARQLALALGRTIARPELTTLADDVVRHLADLLHSDAHAAGRVTRFARMLEFAAAELTP